MATAEDKSRLKEAILRQDNVAAESLAGQLKGEAAPVLFILADHASADVRRTVLEVAGQLSDAGASRVIIKFLDDPEPDLPDLAVALLPRCSQKEVLPQLLEAMEKRKEPPIRGPLALQVGVVGTAAQIPTLQKYRKENGAKEKDPDLDRKLELALARLGDGPSREKLIARIHAADLRTRYQALQDCVYVQYKQIAVHFDGPLADLRNVLSLSMPGDPPETARICDVAALVLAKLGYKLSFGGEELHRRTDAEMKEAWDLVKKLQGS
jgi:hypothetical protein